MIVKVKNLSKTYGLTKAVDDISFEVGKGEIFCIVGPNGAGKTTTLECIEGLRRTDGGSIEVLGLDPWRDEYKLREKVGIQLQASELPGRIKVWEALDLFASFYEHPVNWQELLEKLALTEKRNAYFSKLSGGQKQRLFIALSLLSDPEVFFFDELTTGVDPQARRSIWQLITSIKDRGKTIFLTTHSMEEAERLSDRVAVLDRGKIIALDSPQNLIKAAKAKTLEDVYLSITGQEVRD